MKKLFLVLFSFLFIGTALTGSAFLLAGCNQSYSQEGNEENNENEGNPSDINNDNFDNNFDNENQEDGDEISAQGVSFGVQAVAYNIDGEELSYSQIRSRYLDVGRFSTYWHEGDGTSNHGTLRTWGVTPTRTAAYGYYSAGGTADDTYATNLLYFRYTWTGGPVNRYVEIRLNKTVNWRPIITLEAPFFDDYMLASESSPTYIWGQDNTYPTLSNIDPLSAVSTYFEAEIYVNFLEEIDIIFDTDGGSSMPSETTWARYDYTLPREKPTKEGYTFACWEIEGGVGYSAGLTIPWSELKKIGKTTITMNAVWEPNSYTNRYYYRSSTTPTTRRSQTQTRYYEEDFATLAQSSLSYPFYTTNGWSLYGWRTASTTGTGINFYPGQWIALTTTSTQTFYAIAQRTITLTYHANGGSNVPSSQTTTQYWNMYSTSASLSYMTSVSFSITSSKPTRTGYTFLGWSTSSTATSATYEPGDTYSLGYRSYSSSNSTILFAVWEINDYTNTYYYRSTTSPTTLRSQNQTRTYGQSFSTLTQSSLNYTFYSSNGWSLYGWRTSSTGTSLTYSPNQSVTLTSTSTISLYAIASRTITLDYNVNGGSGSISSQHVTQYWNMSNATVSSSYITSANFTITSSEPTRTGYTFLGWSTSSTATSADYVASATYTIMPGYSSSQNMTLYAVWQVNSYYVDVNMTLNGSGVSKFLGSFDVSANGTVKATNATDFYQQIAYGSTVRVYDIISNAGYTYQSYTINVSGIETSNSNKSNIEIKMPAQAISINLHQVSNVYTMTLDRQGATNGTSAIYMKYGVGWYSNSTATTAITSVPTLPTKAGFTFGGYFTETNGGGTQIVSSSGQITGANNYITANDTVYAKWTANLEAKKDTAGGYYYVEIGNMPQTRVTDNSLISQLNSSTTNGATYYINGTTMVSKKVNNVEYCKYGNNWYKVEPIRWRLAYSSSQKSGYGTTTDTFAVMDTIVYAGQYSATEIGLNSGYVTTTLDEFKKNVTSTTYLATFSANVESFSPTGTTSKSQSANMFISSTDEMSNVLNNKTGSAKYSVKFSDLVSDILGNGIKQYYTRNLGSNTSTIKSYTELGMPTQNLCTNLQGIQFSIKVSEYGCV